MRVVAAFAFLALAPAAAGARDAFRFTDAGGLVLVEVTLGTLETPRVFVLDTGAQPCVFDDDLAERLDLPRGDTGTGRGSAGEFVAERIAHPPPLRLADGQRVRCREAITSDLGEVSAGLGHRLDGVIGTDFFRGHRVTIDYDAKTVRREIVRGAWPPAGTRIPIEVQGGRPYVEARIWVGRHRGVPRRLLVDTGATDAVADELLSDAGVPTDEAEALGLGGGARVALGRFERVAIGGLEWRDVPATVGPVPLIGAGLLRRYNLVIDYDAGWIALTPRATARRLQRRED